jgi:hypothetical protein
VKVKDNEIGRVCSTNVEKRNACTRRIFMGKPEVKRSLGRARCRWVDNIKVNCRMGWYGLDYFGSG